jgi:hypothetical protein
MKYYVIAETRDDCELPTTPEPMELELIGQHIAEFLAMRRAQGFFLNCRQERIPLGTLCFRVVPAQMAD